MFFLNLTAGEFFALVGALGGLITALYLLDRAKRKKTVSTLRFWPQAVVAEEKQTRKRMREPWSLILQVVSLVLLLLAVAQLQWGVRENRIRHHVLLLDTSAWSGAVLPGGVHVIEREKDLAEAYVAKLPASDRVMLVLADALATPVTAFTSDRAQLRRTLQDAAPGYSALNLNQVLTYAQQAQRWAGGQAGEVVYVGPKRIDAGDEVVRLPNLRVLDVPCECEDAGIIRVGVKRVDGTANEWAASVVVKNYGTHARTIRLNTRFGSTVFGARTLAIGGGREAVADYIFDTTSAGYFAAQIDSPDALATDNTGGVTLPRVAPLRVAVFTSRPDILRPLLAANEHITAEFEELSKYTPKPKADLVLLDQFATSQPPEVPSLWIQPPRQQSPLPVKTVVENARLTAWNGKTPLAAGLHARDNPIETAEVFQVFDGDISVAEVAEGPVLVARASTPQHPRNALIGFDPLEGEMKFQVTTPLLFANLLHWLSPQALQTFDLAAARVGTATVALDPNEAADHLAATSAGAAIPFAVHDQTLELFLSKPGEVRISSYDRERVLSLTLPDVAERVWTPPASTRSGLPVESNWTPASLRLWKALAALAALILALEWMLFGWRRLIRRRDDKRFARPKVIVTKAAIGREMVSK